MSDKMSDVELDSQEAEINRAIEELRGVLHEDPAKAGEMPGNTPSSNVIMNIPVDVQIVLGSAEMQVSELMTLQRGSIISLDRRIGEAVDVVVNGRRIARGEIIVLESDPSRFGIRLTEITQAARSA